MDTRFNCLVVVASTKNQYLKRFGTVTPEMTILNTWRHNLKSYVDDAHNVHITEISSENQCLNPNGDNRKAYDKTANRSYRPYGILPSKEKKRKKEVEETCSSND